MTAAVATVARAEFGRGPEWWRSGTRDWRWWTVGVATYALVVVDALFQVRAGVAHTEVGMTVTGELAETTVGLLFWMWRRNAIGPLMLAYVVLQMGGDPTLFFPQSRLAWTLFYPVQWLWQCVWAWMLLAFPSGRIWNRASAYLVAYMTAFLTLVPIAQELFRSEPRTYLYVGHGWSGLERYTWFYGIDTFLIWVPFVAFAVARVVRTAPGARLRFIPLYAASMYVIFFIVPSFAYFYLTATSFVGPAVPPGIPGWWLNYAAQNGLTLLLSAVGALFGLARVRQRRSSVADLVVELGQAEPGNVRETLARTLGDSSLVLGLWLPERRVWVDEQGGELELQSDGRSAVTYVGDHLAVMVHHPDLLDQPRLLEAVGSAGRLALENERLQAELRAQLAELRASRARMVRTADEERRRLERDLHDGAQQRLLTLGMAMQLLRSHLDAEGAVLLAEADAELQQALTELRELARGIHPAILTDQGLDAAARTLATRSPLPVEVRSEGGRVPAHVETAAYFVIAEALSNIAKYAHASRASVTIRHESDEVRVEVRDDGIGGADPARGSGLIGLTDRVGALGGRLAVTSPVGGGTHISAVIPCAAPSGSPGPANSGLEPVGA